MRHYPLFLKTPDEKENYYNLAQPKRQGILDLCDKNGVVAFLAGHTHRQITNEYKGIQLVNGETTSKNGDGRPMGFRLWNVDAQTGMRHEFVKLKGMPEKEKNRSN
jgi:predicted phosphodiesterase|tara:strand:- start:7670 stop:7987 length:318 start_codon:yes stop_codon:yes gene_type:complete